MLFHITQATIADAEAILSLQHLAFASEAELYNDWTLTPLLETIDDVQKAFSSHTVFKAVLDNRTVVGSVRGILHDGVCRIGRLIVRPQHQGRGVGRLLMDHIESHFRNAHAFELFTGSASERNIRFYSQRGYAIISERRETDAVTLVVMRKDLHECQISATADPATMAHD